MATLNEFPEIMQQAREDLLANVSGRFSPEDWRAILQRAHEKLQLSAAEDEEQQRRAWQEVILDFNRSRYWGFVPDYQPPAAKMTVTFGVRSMIFVFLAFTVTLMAVVWRGQIYTSSDDPRDAYIFFAVLALVVANFSYFLWRTRGHKD